MQATALGKVSVPTAGTPVQLTSDKTIFASKIVFTTVNIAGRMFVGKAGMNKTTGAGVITEMFPYAASNGAPDRFEIESEDANLLRVSDYWIDAATNGDGLYVTYFQE
jgi:hypothetical protein